MTNKETVRKAMRAAAKRRKKQQYTAIRRRSVRPLPASKAQSGSFALLLAAMGLKA